LPLRWGEATDEPSPLRFAEAGSRGSVFAEASTGQALAPPK